MGCQAYTLHVLHAHKRIVNVASQYRRVRPRYHAEHAQRVLVVVLVIRRALAAYQHAAAAAACPQVLRVGRPRGAGEAAALLHQLGSAARNAAGVPGPRVVGDVLRPAAVAIRTVGVLVGKRAAIRDAEQLRLFFVPKLAGYRNAPPLLTLFFTWQRRYDVWFICMKRIQYRTCAHELWHVIIYRLLTAPSKPAKHFLSPIYIY